ncbi:hypothetical protein FRC05_002901 [Tulasnella sp. 425]|nr:hypothetical protein FRC05_002901 [Tulasnella sp. 425]
MVRCELIAFHESELSPSLWMDLNQGSNVKLDRLTLGPDADHWGVHRATDGSYQRFRSIGTRDRLARLMDSRTDKLKTNNQIGFVALGFNGDWAFSVHGQVEHRCGKPFQNELTSGKQAQKRVSTVALSSLARLWIIVWEDGTISHNLPINIANQVEDYCQLQHSLKTNGDQSNSGRSKAPKAKPPRNNQPASTTSTQKQQPVPNPTQTTNTAATLSSLANATQSLARQVSQTTNQQRNVASASGAQTLPKPTPVPPPPVQTAANTAPVPKAPITVASTSDQQRNVASASGTQALPKPTLAPPPAANTTVNAASVPKAPIAVASTSSQQPTARPVSARYTTLPLVPKAPAITQPAPQAITLTIPQHAPRVASSQANRPISRVETISAKPRVYVPPKKVSTTLRQLDPADWNDSYEYNKRWLEASA